MREERIVVHPFEQLKIESYQSVEEVNEQQKRILFEKLKCQVRFHLKRKMSICTKGKAIPGFG